MIVETHQHQPATHHWTVSPMSLLYHWRQLAVVHDIRDEPSGMPARGVAGPRTQVCLHVHNIVYLMSMMPGHTRDETSLAVLATALESALDSKDWNRTQSLLCCLLCSDPVYTVDATIIIRLTSLAVRAALASDESDYQADFTSRLGMALVKPLAALVKQLSALECGDGGDWGGDGGTPEKLRLSAVVATPAATAAKSQLTSGRAPPETTGRGCRPQLASRNAPPETASVAQRWRAVATTSHRSDGRIFDLEVRG